MIMIISCTNADWRTGDITDVNGNVHLIHAIATGKAAGLRQTKVPRLREMSQERRRQILFAVESGP